MLIFANERDCETSFFLYYTFMASPKEIEIKLGSSVVGRVDSVRMSDAERQVTINAMRDADLLVDAFAWVAKKIEQFGARLFLRPALKH